jgi:hypothetical protein
VTKRVTEYLSAADLAVFHTNEIVEYLSAGDLAVSRTP